VGIRLDRECRVRLSHNLRTPVFLLEPGVPPAHLSYLAMGGHVDKTQGRSIEPARRGSFLTKSEQRLVKVGEVLMRLVRLLLVRLCRKPSARRLFGRYAVEARWFVRVGRDKKAKLGQFKAEQEKCESPGLSKAREVLPIGPQPRKLASRDATLELSSLTLLQLLS